MERKGLEPIKRTLQAVGLSTLPPGQLNTTLKEQADSLIKVNKTESFNFGTEFDWLFTIAKSRRLLGINILYGFNIAEDVRNSSLYKIVVSNSRMRNNFLGGAK